VSDLFASFNKKYPHLASCTDALNQSFEVCCRAMNVSAPIMVCGNGGSAADAEHIVGELMKNFKRPRPVSEELRQKLLQVDEQRGAFLASGLQKPIPAIALTSSLALSTAIINDTDARFVFAQQVLGYAVDQGVYLGISTSGNAENVILGAICARALGVTTIGLTGKSGGKLKGYVDILIAAPAEDTAEVQEMHLPLYHALCEQLEKYAIDALPQA